MRCRSHPPESASSRRKCQSGYSSPIGLDVVRFLNAVHRCEQPFGLRAGYVELLCEEQPSWVRGYHEAECVVIEAAFADHHDHFTKCLYRWRQHVGS